MDEIAKRYWETESLVTDVVRYQIFVYGSTSRRVLLQAFDDLGELLRGRDGAGDRSAVGKDDGQDH